MTYCTGPIAPSAINSLLRRHRGHQRRVWSTESKVPLAVQAAIMRSASAQGGGERFFAEDAFDAGFGRVDNQVGMAVVRGGDGDDVQLFIRQHFAVVFIAGNGLVWPLLYKVVEGFWVEIACGGQLRLL